MSDDAWDRVERISPPEPAEVAKRHLESSAPGTGPIYGATALPTSSGAHGPKPNAPADDVATSQKKSHLARNVVLIVVAVFFLFVATFIYLFMSMMRRSPPAKFAIQTAERNVLIQQRIGTPLRPSFRVTGEINVSGKNDGFAELTIPVTGPRGEGELFTRELLRDERWKIVFLSYSDPSGSIVLIQSGGSSRDSF